MKAYFAAVKRCAAAFVKWAVLAVLMGCLAGPVGAAFGLALNRANAARGAWPWLLYLLPLGGLAIVWAYRTFGAGVTAGSANETLIAVHAGSPLRLVAAPLIFVSTVVTHLLGGSSGREGAALLLGGALAGKLSEWFRFDEKDCRMLTLCGMSAAFAAVFGTPLAAAVFPLEVCNVGAAYYGALAPCAIAALVGVWIAGCMGLSPTAFAPETDAAADPLTLLRVVALGALLAALSVALCTLFHAAPRLCARAFPNEYLRAAAGGVLIIALSALLGTTDYNGAGSEVLAAALAGQAVPWAFACKMLFTALTIGAGYKGGEIVPIFFTGAAFGCVVGPLLGLSAPLGAALGMAALFCACTNAPLASILLAAEVFGGTALPLFALACAVAYALSGKHGLYRDQRFFAPKLEASLEVPETIEEKSETEGSAHS